MEIEAKVAEVEGLRDEEEAAADDPSRDAFPMVGDAPRRAHPRPRLGGRGPLLQARLLAADAPAGGGVTGLREACGGQGRVYAFAPAGRGAGNARREVEGEPPA